MQPPECFIIVIYEFLTFFISHEVGPLPVWKGLCVCIDL